MEEISAPNWQSPKKKVSMVANFCCWKQWAGFVKENIIEKDMIHKLGATWRKAKGNLIHKKSDVIDQCSLSTTILCCQHWDQFHPFKHSCSFFWETNIPCNDITHGQYSLMGSLRTMGSRKIYLQMHQYLQLIDALTWTLKKLQNLWLMMMAKTHPKHLAEANWWSLSALCLCVKEAAYLQRLLQESFKQYTQLSLVQGLSFDNYNPKNYYQELNSNFMLSGVTYCCSSNYHNMATCITAGYESVRRIQEIFS